MKKIIISPFSRNLRSGKANAKNYPHWNQLIFLLKALDIHVIQIGIYGEQQLIADEQRFNLNPKELEILLQECDFWISVDNFFQHFAHYHKKPGIVIWGPSNPHIFGYGENFNILKAWDVLRPNQFDIWESAEHKPEIFPSADDIFYAIKEKYDLGSVLSIDLNSLTP
jgi:hypothetical protein